MSDANFWIDLHEGALVGRAFALDIEWVVPDVVLYEVEKEGRPPASALTAHGASIASLSGALLERIEPLALEHPAPSPQDITALILAQEEGAILVTGDRGLREAAEAEGVEVHGTLWVMDRMVAEDAVSPAEASRALQAMVASDRRLPKAEVTKRFATWGPRRE